MSTSVSCVRTTSEEEFLLESFTTDSASGHHCFVITENCVSFSSRSVERMQNFFGAALDAVTQVLDELLVDDESSPASPSGLPGHASSSSPADAATNLPNSLGDLTLPNPRITALEPAVLTLSHVCGLLLSDSSVSKSIQDSLDGKNEEGESDFFFIALFSVSTDIALLLDVLDSWSHFSPQLTGIIRREDDDDTSTSVHRIASRDILQCLATAEKWSSCEDRALLTVHDICLRFAGRMFRLLNGFPSGAPRDALLEFMRPGSAVRVFVPKFVDVLSECGENAFRSALRSISPRSQHRWSKYAIRQLFELQRFSSLGQHQNPPLTDGSASAQCGVCSPSNIAFDISPSYRQAIESWLAGQQVMPPASHGVQPVLSWSCKRDVPNLLVDSDTLAGSTCGLLIMRTKEEELLGAFFCLGGNRTATPNHEGAVDDQLIIPLSSVSVFSLSPEWGVSTLEPARPDHQFVIALDGRKRFSIRDQCYTQLDGPCDEALIDVWIGNGTTSSARLHHNAVAARSSNDFHFGVSTVDEAASLANCSMLVFSSAREQDPKTSTHASSVEPPQGSSRPPPSLISAAVSDMLPARLQTRESADDFVVVDTAPVPVSDPVCQEGGIRHLAVKSSSSGEFDFV